MIIQFKNINNSLGTRRLGKEIRNEISQNFNNSDIIVFDFDGIELISNSFADECFGKLVEDFGFNYVKSKTTFRNVNPFVNIVVKKAITDRLRKEKLCKL